MFPAATTMCSAGSQAANVAKNEHHKHDPGADNTPLSVGPKARDADLVDTSPRGGVKPVAGASIRRWFSAGVRGPGTHRKLCAPVPVRCWGSRAAQHARKEPAPSGTKPPGSMAFSHAVDTATHAIQHHPNEQWSVNRHTLGV